MDISFNRVTYDGDLSDLSEDEKDEVIREFENAQESNVAEFERAAETLDEVDETDIEEFADAKAELASEVTEAEAFDDVPLTEDELADASFSKVREWHEFVSETADGADGETDEDDDKDFDEMGKQGPTHGDDKEFDSDLADRVDEIPGLIVSQD